ncbi:hypothetical protein SAMN05421504_110223 [Amycolatopsis xylanica]|uniref:Uncharacterized protein n=1 Tax=Amycolatopsis xylanica TaxID=589385 RepID=A0A1H3R244_9PSEU|nr:hypothetical protein [Amycolatopsis xylanica]SDZ19690.1 hypothetical protein SAMN05421504_110223 [Amycolatopsis xylanica]
MRIRSLTVAAAFAVAAVLIPFTASPASAAAVGSKCTTSDGGALGAWDGTFSSPWSISGLHLSVYDEKADGHHPGVRLITYDTGGVRNPWPWHEVYGGKGDGDIWNTSANDDAGIFMARVEVGNFEGSELLKSCLSAVKYNPLS